jgi:hemerythrin-like domain-containing protein
MPIQINQRPDHTFDEPLGLLSDCHRRIEHFLRLLVAVTDNAGGGSLSTTHRRGFEDALRYFANAAPKHTADEEASLFPRLRQSGDPAAGHALALIERLEHEHDEADRHHGAVEMLVRRWLAEDRLPESETRELRHHLAELQQLYERHIGIEDRELFPAAARLLDANQIIEIGREMAARRQPAEHEARRG